NMSDTPARPEPEQMRETVREYVLALHTTYVEHVKHLPPAQRGALPLISTDHLSVIAAAAHSLHLIATDARLPAPTGPEVALGDEYLDLRWTLRFYDPSILPSLGILREDTPNEVRRILGISNAFYHLTVDPGGGLTAHHAQHSAVALANTHSKIGRDLDRIRDAFSRHESIVDEFETCVRLGLNRSAALLASELTSNNVRSAFRDSTNDILAAVTD